MHLVPFLISEYTLALQHSSFVFLPILSNSSIFPSPWNPKNEMSESGLLKCFQFKIPVASKDWLMCWVVGIVCELLTSSPFFHTFSKNARKGRYEVKIFHTTILDFCLGKVDQDLAALCWKETQSKAHAEHCWAVPSMWVTLVLPQPLQHPGPGHPLRYSHSLSPCPILPSLLCFFSPFLPHKLSQL